MASKLKVVSLPVRPVWYCKHPSGGLEYQVWKQNQRIGLVKERLGIFPTCTTPRTGSESL